MYIAIKLTKFNYVIVYFAFSVRDTIGFQDSITTRPFIKYMDKERSTKFLHHYLRNKKCK
jgi:hypothetical protein